MSTQFLKDRYPKIHKEVFGETTVKYYEFNTSSRDALTGDITESTAYSSVYTELSAQVNFSPSKALREKIGLSIKFEALLTLNDKELDADEITVKIGDKFVIPDHTTPYYVHKIYKGKQVDDRFLDLMVALSREVVAHA